MTSLGVGSLFGTYDDTNAPVIKLVVGGAAQAARNIQAVKADWKTEPVFQRLNNGNGVPVGYKKIRSVRTVSLECVVRAAASGGIAASKLAIRPPDEFTKVTLEDFIGNDDAFLNGDYVYEGGASVGLTDEGEAVLKFDIMQFYKSDGTAITPDSLLATVS